MYISKFRCDLYIYKLSTNQLMFKTVHNGLSLGINNIKHLDEVQPIFIVRHKREDTFHNVYYDDGLYYLLDNFSQNGLRYDLCWKNSFEKTYLKGNIDILNEL